MPINAHSDDTSYPVIVIVDDDVDLREALQEILEFSGYVVFAAASAQEGLRLLRYLEEPPSLIISDIRMSDVDGYQFRQQVFSDERLRNVPVVFLTARNKIQEEARRGSLDSDGYMIKPFAVEDLLATVRRILVAGSGH
jgi:DNA-binding response OmpR family regulator